jgi:hypothetical protein
MVTAFTHETPGSLEDAVAVIKELRSENARLKHRLSRVDTAHLVDEVGIALGFIFAYSITLCAVMVFDFLREDRVSRFLPKSATKLIYRQRRNPLLPRNYRTQLQMDGS